jgi:hypothetical protein
MGTAVGIQILVAKYVSDLRRWEPQNIGVVVVADAGAQARFRGERPDQTIDRRRIGTSPPEVYAQWVAFWRRSIANGTTGLHHAMQTSNGNYLLVEASEVVFGGATTDLEALVDRYYEELVEHPGTAPTTELSLDQVADQLLQRAGIAALPTFKQGLFVPSADLRPIENFRFHYGWENGHRFLAQRVSLEDADGVDAVNWRFNHVDRTYQKVALVRRQESARAGDLEAQLTVQANLLIDVASARAPSQLVALAG